ncbi:putative tyrosine phosphatase [Paratrimastix pyriformis]|uniref:very-long-chain (3R)-3-hydroxyacyl-CoA dehydratase n=1 Tax=Paratrimastix pyriformis TaxID=342808 RepID=A0ABQ8UVI1_9EUKA|nr:putative tyrosine phosphatase [Paratrimastix pyriformis]
MPQQQGKHNGTAPTWVKSYLLFYNSMQLIGWFIPFVLTVHHFLFANGNLTDLWPHIKFYLQAFHLTMLLEIVHPILGLVRSSPGTIAIQVCSRCYITFLICTLVPESTAWWAFPMMVFSWTITEIIRYTYFITEALQVTPRWLTFIRYSTFLVLYPTGAGGEWLCAFKALPWLPERDPFAISLPNALNASFSTAFLTKVMLVLYIGGLPYMYGHMLSQRAKHLRTKH